MADHFQESKQADKANPPDQSKIADLLPGQCKHQLIWQERLELIGGDAVIDERLCARRCIIQDGVMIHMPMGGEAQCTHPGDERRCPDYAQGKPGIYRR